MSFNRSHLVCVVNRMHFTSNLICISIANEWIDGMKRKIELNAMTCKHDDDDGNDDTIQMRATYSKSVHVNAIARATDGNAFWQCGNYQTIKWSMSIFIYTMQYYTFDRSFVRSFRFNFYVRVRCIYAPTIGTLISAFCSLLENGKNIWR